MVSSAADAFLGLASFQRRLKLRALEELYAAHHLDQVENPPCNDLHNSDEKGGQERSTALNYGEMTVPAFADLLDLAWPERPDERQGGGLGRGVFVDLGCGTGKLVLAAAIMRPHSFRVCKGVELVDELVHKAVAAQLGAHTLFDGDGTSSVTAACNRAGNDTAADSSTDSSSSSSTACTPSISTEDTAEVVFEVGDITDASTWLTSPDVIPETAAGLPETYPPQTGSPETGTVKCHGKTHEEAGSTPPWFVFICCTLFDSELLAAVSALCDKLPPLTVVATVSKRLPSLRLKPMPCSPVTMQMTWGVSTVYCMQIPAR